MIDKTMASVHDAVADVFDAATVMIGCFGTAGMPVELIDALIAKGAGDLTIINNNAGNGETGLAALIEAGRVRKIICSFPRQSDSQHFDAAYRAGKIELELVPQGNLAARIQAGGAGLGAIYTPTGFGTLLAEGKETRRIDGRDYVLDNRNVARMRLLLAGLPPSVPGVTLNRLCASGLEAVGASRRRADLSSPPGFALRTRRACSETG